MNAVREQYLGEERQPARNGRRPDAQTEAAPDIHRTLPHSVEAEQGVLGSMLVGGFGTIDDVRALLPSSEAFYIPAHQVIYNYLLASRDAGIPTDLITFTQQLRDGNELDKIGGASFLTSLFTFVPTAANVRYYADIVRDKQTLRGIIATATEAAWRAYEEQDDVPLLLEEFAGNVIEIGMRNAPEALRHIGDFVPEALAQIRALYLNRGQITGLATGFHDFDRATNGLEPGYNYVFGARPAMGKTSWALGIADYIAVQMALAGKIVQIFTLEMTGAQVARRLICAGACISLSSLRFGFLPKEALPQAEAAAERLIKSHIMIDDKAGLNIYEFRARTRRAVLKYKAAVILVDYLGMMHGVSRRARENRQLEVSECIQGIAETAKELQVPIVTLAQLNRGPEERKWGVPEISDLRESGDIENYAHLIGLLWRPIYYCKDEKDQEKCARWLKIFKTERSLTDGELHPVMDDGDPPQPVVDLELFKVYAQIIITKQREGATGPIPIRFIAEHARFESMTDRLFSNNPEHRQPGTQEEEFYD